MREHCNLCGAAIRWAAHERTGNVMILDREPDESGNVELIVVEGEERAVVHVTGQMAMPWESEAPARYMPHQATCGPYQERRARERAPGQH